MKEVSPLQMVEDIENAGSNMSTWESDFVDDISTQVKAEKNLSEKQLEKLTEIWRDHS